MKKLSFYLTLVTVSFLFQVLTSISISQWQTYQTPVQSSFSDVCVVNPNVIWASGGTVVRTTNGGSSWIVAVTGLPAVQFYHITAIDENNAWVTGGAFNGGQIFRTTNGGINWVEQTYNQPYWINGIHFFNANTGIFLRDPLNPPNNDTSGFFITRNGGLNWYSSPNSPRTTMLVDFCISVFDTNLVSFQDNNKFYRLTGGLDNPWQSVSIDSMGSYSTSACFINSNTGYLADGVGNGFRLFRSTNSGLNWSVISRDDGMVLYRLLCFANSPLFFMNDSRSITLSTNSGITWAYHVEYNNSDSISLGGMDGFDTTSVWIAVSKGRLFKYNSAYIGINQLSTQIPQAFRLYQNYPNPFNPSTKIKFDLPNAGEVKFKIFDVTGREVYEVNEFRTAGKYELNFDASGYSSGVYFYSVEFGGLSQTNRMILLK